MLLSLNWLRDYLAKSDMKIDPKDLADKLTMLTVTLMLAAEGLLPGWLAAAVIARDVIIVFGAIAFHFLIYEYEMAPTRLSNAARW